MITFDRSFCKLAPIAIYLEHDNIRETKAMIETYDTRLTLNGTFAITYLTQLPGSSGSLTLDEMQDSQLLITREEKRQRRQPGGGGGVCETPKDHLKDTMVSPPEESPSTAVDDDSDSDHDHKDPQKEKNDHSGTTAPTDGPESGNERPPATSVSEGTERKESLGKGKGGAGMVMVKKETPLAAKSKAKKTEVEKAASPKNVQNTQQLSSGTPPSGGQETKAERSERLFENQVQDALNRSGTAERIDESKPDEKNEPDQKKNGKVKKSRDKVAHARKMRFYRSLDSWGLRKMEFPDYLGLYLLISGVQIVPSLPDYLMLSTSIIVTNSLHCHNLGPNSPSEVHDMATEARSGAFSQLDNLTSSSYGKASPQHS